MKNLNGDRKRILLVETDEDTLALVPLQIADYKFVLARDFEEGLLQARKRYFDLYLLGDLHPKWTIVELCRRIREFDPFTPILFYSGWAAQSHMREALAAGAQAYLIKPVHSQELIQAIRRATSAATQSALGARRAEIDAVREELATRRMENAFLIEESRMKAQRANKKLMRLRARQAFLASGGTRGDFAREWASGFMNKIREGNE